MDGEQLLVRSSIEAVRERFQFLKKRYRDSFESVDENPIEELISELFKLDSRICCNDSHL